MGDQPGSEAGATRQPEIVSEVGLLKSPSAR
jgi:hypothetical protein